MKPKLISGDKEKQYKSLSNDDKMKLLFLDLNYPEKKWYNAGAEICYRNIIFLLNTGFVGATLILFSLILTYLNIFRLEHLDNILWVIGKLSIAVFLYVIFDILSGILVFKIEKIKREEAIEILEK